MITWMGNLLGRAPRGARGLKWHAEPEGTGRDRRAPRGARGLKWIILQQFRRVKRRAPRGARGLKFLWDGLSDAWNKSRPSRGAWIEISTATATKIRIASRAPRGARGLKSLRRPARRGSESRAPRGARGLKSLCLSLISSQLSSRPSRGAWIEIFLPLLASCAPGRAPRGARGLKFVSSINIFKQISRAPHGARGLK